MAAPGQGPNTDVFNSYFLRADLDRDGRISGPEAVAFFQGSNLPKQVLAQIWTYADQNRTSFLGRPEFYNALKLVTVAQSGRQLTPEIVKAALYGPAAAKIPAPQINPVSSPAAQMNPVGTSTPQLNSMASPSSQMGVVAPTASQNPGFRGPQENTSLGMNRQFFPSSDNQFTRPSQATLPVQGVQGLPGAGTVAGPHPQGLPGAGSVAGPHPQGPPSAVSMSGPRPPISNSPNLSTDWFSGRTTGASVGGISQGSVGGVSPSTNQDRFGIVMPSTSGVPTKPQTISSPALSLTPKPLDQVLSSSQPAINNSRAMAISGNGFSSDSVFGGDVYAANSQSKPDASTPSFPLRSMTNTSGTGSVGAGSQNTTRTGQLDALPSSSILSQGVGQFQQTPSLVKQNLDTLQSTSAMTPSNVSVGPGASASSQSQPPWPRITQSNIQKYTNVFVEVDKDRDGKITGDEARNLFLSWKLPREVLKQVWDLSDQDNDSMLSLREFCIALYLMERFREGRPLPAVLPNTVKFDETLLRATPQTSTSYSGQTWKPNPGMLQQGIPGSRPPLPVPGVRPPMHSPIPFQADGSGHLVQQRSRGPTLENHLTNQLGNGEQSEMNSRIQEATEADKNVQELEKQILDSREKIEFYRTKMQELILYKSRCDNRLNEITERALADKREAESLAKRYEEKYKQVGEIASKLTVEEATYRHVQERKLELQNAIVKMEQGGSADGLLQVRADRIQSDLEELMKALNDRCKHQGLNVKPSARIELPFGWQPGIQEGAFEWNEDWDKFKDEGFSVVKELSVAVDNAAPTAKPMSPSYWSDKDSMDGFSPVSSSKMSSKKKHSSTADQITETESANDPGEEGLARSSPGSPGRNVFDSPSQEFDSTQFGINDASPHAKGSHSDHGGVESSISGDKFADEPSWNFDGNDDVDSVWGFDTRNTKEQSDYETSKHNSLFSSGDYGLNPIKVDSPGAGSTFGKEKSSFFADSVPSTPLFSSGASPKFNDGPEDHSFSTFGRFDSFSTNDGGFFTQRESFARFDSIRSTADFEHRQGGTLSRFDSMRSTVDFDHRQGETLARFDSMRSTADFDHSRAFPSFDDADPFGSTGPFKSSDSHSPRKGSDSWSAF